MLLLILTTRHSRVKSLEVGVPPQGTLLLAKPYGTQRFQPFLTLVVTAAALPMVKAAVLVVVVVAVFAKTQRQFQVLAATAAWWFATTAVACLHFKF